MVGEGWAEGRQGLAGPWRPHCWSQVGKEARWEGSRRAWGVGTCERDCAGHGPRWQPLSPRVPGRCQLIAQGPPPRGRHLCLAVPISSRQEQEPHLRLCSAARGRAVCSGAQSGSGRKENTRLSAVISPRHGSHHQLPAEMGLFRLTRYSWRWRGADGPAWPRFQPDCQGGVGRAAGLVPGAGMHWRRAGASSLPSPWGLACMEGLET